MATFYIDTSHHDRDRRGSNLDWAQIMAATSPVMVTKVTEGDPGSIASTDPYGVQAIKDARAAGAAMYGGYHVPRHGDQASTFRQVDFLRRQLDLAGANWAMLDSEPFSELGSNWPRLSDIQRFDDRWNALDERVLAHYLPHSFWNDHLGQPSLTSLRGPLVASNYGDNVALAPAALYLHRGGDNTSGWNSYGGKTVAILQFGSQCRVPGASAGSDINAFRGTVAQLISLLQGKVDTLALPDSYALALAWRVEAIINGRDKVLDGPSKGEVNKLAGQMNKFSTDLATLTAKVDAGEPATLSDADRAAISAAILAGLDMTALAAAVADTVMARITALRFGVQG